MIKLNSNMHIYRNNTLKGKIPAMDLDKECSKVLDSLKNRFGSTDSLNQTINEPVRNTGSELFCKAFTLTISKTDDGTHMLKVSMLHPAMLLEDTRLLAAGDRNEILKYLNDDRSTAKLKQDLFEMSEKLSEK